MTSDTPPEPAGTGDVPLGDQTDRRLRAAGITPRDTAGITAWHHAITSLHHRQHPEPPVTGIRKAT